MNIVFKITQSFLLSCLFLAGVPQRANAQQFTQTVKGTITDRNVKTPLAGATVRLRADAAGPEAPVLGAVTDAEGRFKISGVPLGRYALVATYLGYKDAGLGNITVNSGKEVDLNIGMDEAILLSSEVVIRAKTEKQKPLNDLSTVSARTFSVEETQRFAAAINDPARMASAFAGVVSPGDGNEIVIRGNAPNGLLWRMEGVDIPNPNHFASQGTSGGGVSILSAQVLANSDFSTGAFAAEYGNALSGVFDLKLRKGNDEKMEYTFQAGFLGLDAAVEGPLRVGSQTGSFLFNYRYSTLSVISGLGVEIGDGRTDFQDLSFNIWMPAGKAGVFTLFGLGGLSKQTSDGLADSTAWRTDPGDRYSDEFISNTGVMGLTHSKIWGNTYLKTVVAVSGNEQEYQEDFFLLPGYAQQRQYDQRHLQRRYTLSSTLNHKFNARHFVRAGAYANVMDFNFKEADWDRTREVLRERIRNNGQAQTLNAFAQWQYKPTERLTLNTGVHTYYFALNKKYSVEPRFGAKYAFNDRQSVSFGYGRHAQMQPLGTYFFREANGNMPNQDLDLTKAHHLVLGFDQMLPGNLHLKTEVYYQHLFDAPVSAGKEPNAFSLLNQIDGFAYERLANTGRGRNYGVELTFEKFLTNGLYFMLSSALFESQYQGSDNIWRNTRYNSSYASSFTAGKEWGWKRRGKDRSFGLNLRATHTGNLRVTPIDLVASEKARSTVRTPSRTFEESLPDFLRCDVGVRLKRNYARTTTTLSLDVQNAANRKNPISDYYRVSTKKVAYNNLIPLIPILAYKIEF